MNTLKTLRAALECLRCANGERYLSTAYQYQKSITDLATLIASLEAQPVGEPVWYACDTEGAEFDVTFVTTQEEAAMAVECALADDPDLKFEDLVTPLYAAPVQPVEQPKAVPLTDEQIDKLWWKEIRITLGALPIKRFARVIERAHGIGGGE